MKKDKFNVANPLVLLQNESNITTNYVSFDKYQIKLTEENKNNFLYDITKFYHNIRKKYYYY